jgi:hypothetical protein
MKLSVLQINRLDKKPNAPLLIANKQFFVFDYQVHR